MALRVLLCKRGSLLGDLVGIAESGSVLKPEEIVHIGIDLGDGYAAAEEAAGFWVRPIEQYGTNPWAWTMPLNAAGEARARAWIKSQIGTAYNFAEIGVDALELVFKRTVPFHPGNTFVCSSAAAQCMSIGGLNPWALAPFNKSVYEVTPSDWKVYILAQPPDVVNTPVTTPLVIPGGVSGATQVSVPGVIIPNVVLHGLHPDQPTGSSEPHNAPRVVGVP